MSLAVPVKRETCPACQRPQSSCICRWITPTAHKVEVVLLQHPLEIKHAKNSARLLHLSLPRSVLVVGEVFPEKSLQALISAPLDSGTAGDLPWCTALLYPDSPHSAALGMPPALALAAGFWPDLSRLRLIVLDGTWRKSRKMLYLNPLLQRLPRLALRNGPESRYRIRKAHKPGQLSTLEATCAALAQLEGETGLYAPLLAAFDGFVAQQQSYRAKAAEPASSNPPSTSSLSMTAISAN